MLFKLVRGGGGQSFQHPESHFRFCFFWITYPSARKLLAVFDEDGFEELRVVDHQSRLSEVIKPTKHNFKFHMLVTSFQTRQFKDLFNLKKANKLNIT